MRVFAGDATLDRSLMKFRSDKLTRRFGAAATQAHVKGHTHRHTHTVYIQSVYFVWADRNNTFESTDVILGHRSQ